MSDFIGIYEWIDLHLLIDKKYDVTMLEGCNIRVNSQSGADIPNTVSILTHTYRSHDIKHTHFTK